MAKGDSSEPKYTVRVDGVSEVIVRGRSDPNYWAPRLAPYSLFPHREAGTTEVAFGAAQFRWKGIGIRELWAAVNVSLSPGGEKQDGVYFLGGYHGSGLFAWVERNLLKTPYYRATRLRIEQHPDAGQAEVELADAGGTFLHARRLATSPPNERVDTTWEGPIFLSGRPQKPYLFYASLGGPTAIYAFDPEQDTLTLPPAGHRLAALAESGFEPNVWWLRQGGRHGRSKTLRHTANDVPFRARETVAALAT